MRPPNKFYGTPGEYGNNPYFDAKYISVVSSAGEAITLTLGQYLGKNQFIDLRLTEAIFKKEDGKYLILDFNNQIREADDY